MEKKSKANTRTYRKHAVFPEDCGDTENAGDELAIKIILQVFELIVNMKNFKNGGINDAER